jgi:lipid-binding SYLF domain-containing protein
MKNSQSAASPVVLGLLAAVALAPMGNAYADDVKDANETLALFKKTDSNLARFFESAVGYAVFPSVGKGGMGFGGAYGSGVLYQRGQPVGKTTLTQVTIGFQLGGQAYSEIIFFESERVLSDFKGGNFAFAGQASAVALASGASANANYQWGVAVFTAAKGGLMFEASIGGQKFTYEPFGKRK